MSRSRRLIGILAFTQITSWGALYYAFSIVAPAMARDLAIGSQAAYGAFSLSLLVAGIMATPAGAMIDRWGGRPVMAAGSLLCGAGLLWLSACGSAASYYGAWTLLGIAMALTLYEAAFAAINRQIADGARQAMSTLTLFGGFASTVFWPLTWYLSTNHGWRDLYFWYGLVQIALCLPLHLLIDKDRSVAAPRRQQARSLTLSEAVRHGAFWKLAMAFSANTFVFSAMSVHLLPLLRDYGHTARFAVLVSALIGPTQVIGRLLERTVARDMPPLVVGKYVFGMLPAALLALLLFGDQAAAVALFCMLYGLSNGVLTIVRGTVPQELFGRENYGAISGAMAGPALLSKAAGPLAAAMLMPAMPAPSALVLLLLCCSLAALFLYLKAIAAARHHGRREDSTGVDSRSSPNPSTSAFAASRNDRSS